MVWESHVRVSEQQARSQEMGKHRMVYQMFIKKRHMETLYILLFIFGYPGQEHSLEFCVNGKLSFNYTGEISVFYM